MTAQEKTDSTLTVRSAFHSDPCISQPVCLTQNRSLEDLLSQIPLICVHSMAHPRSRDTLSLVVPFDNGILYPGQHLAFITVFEDIPAIHTRHGSLPHVRDGQNQYPVK